MAETNNPLEGKTPEEIAAIKAAIAEQEAGTETATEEKFQDGQVPKLGQMVNYHHNGNNSAIYGHKDQVWPAVVIRVQPVKDKPSIISLRVFNQDNSGQGNIPQVLSVQHETYAGAKEHYFTF